MSGGAHGLQPDGHEHVHCDYCGANGVHVLDSWPGLTLGPNEVVFATHNQKGMTLPCAKSRGKVVPAQHRHQGDPR